MIPEPNPFVVLRQKIIAGYEALQRRTDIGEGYMDISFDSEDKHQFYRVKIKSISWENNLPRFVLEDAQWNGGSIWQRSGLEDSRVAEKILLTLEWTIKPYIVGGSILLHHIDPREPFRLFIYLNGVTPPDQSIFKE